jgi:hypothetical protein
VAGGLQAGVTVTVERLGKVGALRRDERVHPGDLVVFQARVLGHRRSAQVRWTASGGAEVSPEGLFTAPDVVAPTTFWVRAASVEESHVGAEASVAVLPGDRTLLSLAGAMDSAMGPECWAAFNARGLPFLDLESGRRYGPSAQVKPSLVRPSGCRPCVVGYGLPVRVRLAHLGSQARGHLLSLEEGEGVSRYDLGGEDPITLTVRGKVGACRVESLYGYAEGRRWGSVVLPFSIQVRGLVPFAGNPVTDEAATVDGRGLSARFERPAGLARMALPGGKSLLLVSDDQSHVVRSISPEGQVATVAGKAGEPGYLDGPGEKARLCHPTFLASSRVLPGILIADAGNHAIRLLDEHGAVTTLAGNGTPGHVDGSGRLQARFHSPQGLAWGPDGSVYVADAGNQCIRKIAFQGWVTTLTGPRAPEGPGRGVALRALKGLLLMGDRLYALNGHQLVRIALDGRAEPLVGREDTPGFGAGLGGGACLNNPYALAEDGGSILISDRDNNALRRLHLGAGPPRLETLVGDPGRAATRWGLLRDDLPGDLLPGYAALDHPRGLACRAGDGLHITSGRCVAEVSMPGDASADLGPPAILPGGGEALEVRGPRSRDGHALGFRWWLEVFAADPRGNPDQEPLHRASGAAPGEDHGASIPLPPGGGGSSGSAWCRRKATPRSSTGAPRRRGACPYDSDRR